MNDKVVATNVDSGASTSGEKRKLVPVAPDDNSAEIKDAKKPKGEVDKKMWMSVLCFMLESNVEISDAFGLFEPFKVYISVSMQVHNVVLTCHNLLRQQTTNNSAKTSGKGAVSDFVVNFNNKVHSIERDVALKVVSEAAKRNGIPYASFKKDDKENWYGTARPILNFSHAHQLRLSDVRDGHFKIPVRRAEGNVKFVETEDTGIFGCHHIFAEGLFWPPENASSMSQYIGPLAALIQLIQSPKKYSHKWKAAVMKVMSHIPEINTIVDSVAGKSFAETRRLVALLGDILLMTGCDKPGVMYFPTNVMCHGLYPELIAGKKPILSGNLSDIAAGFDYSGEGGMLLYKRVMGSEFYYPGSHTEEAAAQVFFHSVFGTYTEDFGVLSTITEIGKWYTREELGEGFWPKFQNSKFTIPRMKFWSELHSLRVNELQSICSHLCSNDSWKIDSKSFIDHICQMQLSGLTRIAEMLKKFKSILLKEMIKYNFEFTCGTSDWYSIDELEIGNKGNPVGIRVVCSGLLFRGLNAT